jgi:hypothetical protein
MSAKPVKAPKTSVTKRATSRRVSPHIKSAFTPVQTNAARLRASAALSRANLRTNQSMIKSPLVNGSRYFGMYAALQRAQAKYRLSKTRATAMKQSATQSQQLARGSFQTKQAALRSSKAQIKTLALYGFQKNLRRQVTQAAGAIPPPIAVVRVSVRTRNTSAAARLAQSRRATAGNKARVGTKYKKGGGSSGSGKTSAPRIASIHPSRSRSRTRTSAPRAALQTPKASKWIPAEYEGELLNPWCVAGNNRGVENCAAVAIANHLWYHKSLMMTDDQVVELSRHSDNIPGLLKHLQGNEAFENVWPESWYHLRIAGPGDVIVYDVPEGDSHAVLLVENLTVVSWGKEVPFKGKFTEGWHIVWRTYRKSARR